MIIRKYGIELVRVREKDIELIRQRRNDPSIREKMFFQDYISKEDQKRWFQSIDDDRHYFFLIHSEGKKIGMIHGEIYSYEDRVAEGGVFIWDASYLGSHIPVIASICMADLTFFVMDMYKTVATVRTDNTNAVRYNLDLGYKITEEDQKEGKLFLELTKEDYMLKSQKIRSSLSLIYKSDEQVDWNDIEFFKNDFAKLYANLPDYLREKIIARMFK